MRGPVDVIINFLMVFIIQPARMEVNLLNGFSRKKIAPLGNASHKYQRKLYLCQLCSASICEFPMNG